MNGLLKTVRGLSLLEVMVAAGMVGVVSLGVASLVKQQVIVQKRSESSFEVNSISNLISQILLNSNACNETLGIGTTISNGLTISEIKNRSGNTVFNTTNKYGNNLIKLDSMTLKNLNVSAPGGGNQYGEVQLEVIFKKLNKVIKGSKKVIKRFTLGVELNSSNGLVKCYSATENAVQTAKQEACSSIGGIFDLSTNNCNLSSFNSTDPLSNSKAVSTQSQRDFVNHVINSELDPKYVDVVGDTMSGRLQVNAKIETNDRVCVSGRCRQFQESACSAGQVVKKIKADGTVECARVTCPNPKDFYQGLDSSGNPICKTIFGNTCPNGQVLIGFDDSGNFQCSNSFDSEPVKRYLSDHCKVCVACSDDGRWDMVVCDDFFNDGWKPTHRGHCADTGVIAIKVVCEDSYSDAPNASP